MRTRNYLGHWIVTVGSALIGGFFSLLFTWPFHLSGIVGGAVAGYLWCCWMDRLIRKHLRVNTEVWVGGIFSGSIAGLIATIFLYLPLLIPTVELGNQTGWPSAPIITVGVILSLIAGIAYGAFATLILSLFHRHPVTPQATDSGDANA